MPAYGVETILKRPPRDSSYGARGSRVSTIGVASDNDMVLNNWVSGNTVLQTTAVWITWIADTDCYIAFYQQGAAGTVMTSTNGIFLPAGVYLDLWHIPRADDRVAFIQKTAGGNLFRWQSSL
jgi:hypothetical protein